MLSLFVDRRPLRTGVVAAIERAAVRRVDDRVSDLRIRRRDGHERAADLLREAVVQLRPGRAAVGRLVDAATLDLEARLPRGFARGPQRRVDGVRVARVERDVERARVVVGEQHAPERRASVGRPVDAALLIRAVRVPERRDEQAVRVMRIDRDRGDLLGVAQAEVRPRRARVGGLVHAVADREVGPVQAFPAAGVDRVVVARRHRERTDRTGALAVEDRRPRPPGVVRPPHAAVHGRHVEAVRLVGNPAHRRRAPPAQRPDEPPLHPRIELRRDPARLSAGRAGCGERGEERHDRGRKGLPPGQERVIALGVLHRGCPRLAGPRARRKPVWTKV